VTLGISTERSLWAKMRAASDFARARVYADLSANTFRIEIYPSPSGASSWTTEGGNYISVSRCDIRLRLADFRA